MILMLDLNFSMAADSAKATGAKAVLRNDTTAIKLRNFDKTALKSYSKQPAFKYDGTYTDTSLWSRFWGWFWKMADSLLSKKYSARIVSYLLIAVGLSAITFLVLKLTGVDALNIFRRRSAAAGLANTNNVENIHKINFDSGIEKAEAAHNYRLAVRLLYLKCLKQLSDAGHIRWEINKTNSDYLNELSNQEQRIAFQLLTQQFEYIWYGEFTLDASVFKKINSLFHDFKIGAA
jgi:hypothetical protein